MTGVESGRFDLTEVTTLYRLGKLVRASLDLDTALGAIADAACELTNAELSAILLLDSDELVLRVGRGAVATAVGERVPASAGIAGRALSERRTVLVCDMHAEPDRARPDLDARSGVRTYLAVPLIWDDLALGVVTVAGTTPDALGRGDAAMVEELAEHAAAAVAHARAYAREQDQRTQALQDRHGIITLTTRCDDDGVRVTVADNGSGINPEHLSRVFDPFFSTRAPVWARAWVCPFVTASLPDSVELSPWTATSAAGRR